MIHVQWYMSVSTHGYFCFNCAPALASAYVITVFPAAVCRTTITRDFRKRLRSWSVSYMTVCVIEEREERAFHGFGMKKKKERKGARKKEREKRKDEEEGK